MLESLTRGRSRLELARYGAFYLVAVVFLVMAVQAVGFLLEWGVTAWFTTAFGDHRVHQIVDGVLIGGMILGVLVQLYRPERRVAAMQSTIVLMVVFSAFAFLGGGPAGEVLPFLVFALVLGVLHPSGQEMLRPYTAGRFSPRLAGLVAVAAVPLVAFAANQFGLQLSVVDEHAAIGHWGSMAAFALSVGLVGLLASLKTRWWLYPVGLAGVFAAVHGLASMLFSTASSVGALWGGLELLWGVAFVVVAVLEYRGVLGGEAVQQVEPAGAD